MFKYTDADGDVLVAKIIKHVLVALLVLAIVFGSFGTVQAGERGVKTRFGTVVGILGTGLYIKLPFIEQVHDMSVKTLTVQFDNKSAASTDSEYSSLAASSKDLQDVALSVVVNYNIDAAKVDDIYQQYSSVDNYQLNVIEPIIRQSVKSTASQYTAEELVTKRQEVADVITKTLTSSLAEKYAVLETFSITNFEFSKSFSDAIEAKVTAVQNAEAAKNKLVQVQYEAQQAEEEATGKAKAEQIEGDALRSNPAVIQLRAIEKWNGALPQVTGGSIPMVDIK